MTDRSKPFISVIIAAYKRKEYILEAFQSVLEQDIDRSKYEIIVVKSFLDREIDSKLEEKGARLIYAGGVKIGKVGKTLAKGISAASGEVLCFLDDDDMFERTKLSRIEKLFSENAKLCFYHNSQMFCDENSKPLPEFKRNKKTPGNISFDNTDFGDLLEKMKRTGTYLDSLWFNLSSISVRRKIFDDRMSYVEKIAGHPDDLMFYLAYSMPVTVTFVNEDLALTFYRSHNSTTSIVTPKDSQQMTNVRVRQYEDFALSSEIFVELMRKSDISRYAEAKHSYDLAYMYNTQKDSLKLVKQTLKLALKGHMKNIEFSFKKRMVTYFGFFIFAVYYVISGHIPSLRLLSAIFPDIESLRR